MKKTLQMLLKQLASLKLAVIVIVTFTILMSVGTFVEARYDATAAGKLVYKTFWMFSVLGLLVINLTAVMVDRWPWKKKHAPFVLAHIGIIVLLIGSYITMKWGLDGSMRVGIRESNRFVQSPETDLVIYASFDGNSYVKLIEKEVDFFLRPPRVDPTFLPVGNSEIRVVDYEPYMLADRKVGISDSPTAGAGVRFQIANANVSMNEWLVQRRAQDTQAKRLGLASFIITQQFPEKSSGENLFFMRPLDEGKIEYMIAYRDEKLKAKKGILFEGQGVQTGWMGLEFKVLRYLPKAEEKWDFKKVARPSERTTSAIKISFMGKEHWLQQEDSLKLFSENTAYVVTYAARRIDLGFDLFLKEFEIGRYPGSMMASNYKSHVSIEGAVSDALISMNEPLKHAGLTIYQASFQEDEQGKPVASIFSINYDPGRWLKYLGSFLICLGTVLLFYNKRKASRALAPNKESPEVIL